MPNVARHHMLSSIMGVGLTTENDMSDRIWPGRGPLAASYRVMFPLLAVWAGLSVGVWYLLPGLLDRVADPYLWHVHEMTFGFGAAALVGYLPSACSSWTGRAPVSGAPVAFLAGLWVAARLLMFWSDALSPVVLGFVNAAVFWTLALVLMAEGIRGATAKVWAYVGFLCLAGCVSGAVLIGSAGARAPDALPLLAPLLFAALLAVVGGRMVYGFLKSDASRRDRNAGRDLPLLGWIGAGALALAAVFLVHGQEGLAGLALLSAALSQAIRLSTWPLGRVHREPLLLMLALGFLWLPVGLGLWGAALLALEIIPGPNAIHAMIMGAMSSLIMAVAVRPVARRGVLGLNARPWMLPAFLGLQAAIVMRVADWQGAAAMAWSLAWLLFLAGLLARRGDPVPRPIFSGSRR